ncbi:ATP-dependent helicase [Alkalibaculum sp. M08DMB]|uniref:ATP-dependent helicase n=1 Tax=Alkalibaculum sporogenes TaxID=2655001 RepID=A0A6A7K5G5_9FIRM|nr:DEAD/DEAH box helicase [Alkalibaculum sporogenes]MPW24383.1 ATP-dependent helicase [Alkalibaculum sporogenes]
MAENMELIAVITKDDFYIDYEIISKKHTEAKIIFEQEWSKRFKEDKYSTLFYLGFINKVDYLSTSLNFLYMISDMFIQKISKQPDIEFSRDKVYLEITLDEMEEIQNKTPFINGMEYLDNDWINQIWSRLNEVFRVEINNYEGSVYAFLTEHNSGINVAGRIFFHLVENQDEEYPFAFMATYSSKQYKNKKAVHTPLRNALLEYKGEQEKLLSLLSTVSQVANKSVFISNLMESGELFSPLKITKDEAYTFLSEVLIYEEAGIMCRIPDWWRKKTNTLKLSLSIGDNEPSKVGLDALLSFKPTLYFGDTKITKEEIEELLTQTQGLVLIKGKWVESNHDKLNAALHAFTRAEELSYNENLTLAQAMRLELNVEDTLGIKSKELNLSVSNGQWLSSIKEKMSHPEYIQHEKLDESFLANLRPYQQIGFDWLKYMLDLELGACLADDMGLGKTIQIIALLEYMRNNRGGRVLLIIPASLIGNWQKEIEKFAPMMSYGILHGHAARKNIEDFQERKNFLTITTYGMSVRLDKLMDTKWDLIILDEAQAIKNPNTKQTKRIKELKARTRIAMTGTPIENRLSDLWSLFDFLDGGLLGNAKEFTIFIKGLKTDSGGYAKLRRIVNPFILRRLKTDKSIITDLPDKIELKEYPTLTKKQTVLYQHLVKELNQKLDKAEGIGRKGLVLSSIVKFKQICNHPDQYLGQEDYKNEHSGKFELLKNICETIYEKRERVLVFTQFKEITGPLYLFLKEIFHRPGFVLHGGTSVSKRTQIVDSFNGEDYIPYMVLSLKAGGVGLNLTSANHIIHFDRWWNPAVENQATDRAFRIGQKKDVMVHKFISSGTIEEKIDLMIEEKQHLSGDIIQSSGENWITELSNNQLMELFTLGGSK